MSRKELEFDFEREIGNAYKFREMYAKSVRDGKVKEI